MRFVIIATALVWVGATACSKNSTGPTYDTIAGTYAGSMSGTSQGVALNATFTITITETNSGGLGGSYSLSGNLSQSGTVVPVQGSGTINSGSIASGNNPSVTLTIELGVCPGTPATFSGSYDSVNHVLTMQGPIYIFNSSCQIVLTYPTTIVLTG